MDYAQDCDDANCAVIGATTASLFEREACWILLAYAAHFTGELPRLGDSLIVESWSRGVRGVRFYRENRYYRNTADPEHSFGVGTSEWIICALDSHRPLRPSSVLDMEVFEAGSNREIAHLDRIPKLEPGGSREAGIRFDYLVGYGDLDVNRHLHNTHYVKLAIDSAASCLVVDPSREGLCIHSFQIEFIKEVNYQQTLTISARPAPGRRDRILLEGSSGGDSSFLAAVEGKIPGRD